MTPQLSTIRDSKIYKKIMVHLQLLLINVTNSQSNQSLKWPVGWLNDRPWPAGYLRRLAVGWLVNKKGVRRQP